MKISSLGRCAGIQFHTIVEIKDQLLLYLLLCNRCICHYWKPISRARVAVTSAVLSQVLTVQQTDGAQGYTPADDTKHHCKPDKTLRFSLCSDNLEGISEGQCANSPHALLTQ